MTVNVCLVNGSPVSGKALPKLLDNGQICPVMQDPAKLDRKFQQHQDVLYMLLCHAGEPHATLSCWSTEIEPINQHLTLLVWCNPCSA